METQLIDINRDRILKRISEACKRANRKTSEVKLMAVTKTHAAEVVDLAVSCGLNLVGENRVQEAEGKKPRVKGKATWELIGNLQSNKAKLAINLFDRIQSVDRKKLVNVLNRVCESEGKRNYPILMQINAGRDPAKFGVDPQEAEELMKAILESRHLQLDGLMTIAPLSEDIAVARDCFANLKRIQLRLEDRFSVALPVLSMGMSGDFEVAIEEGSTLVRVGSSLFGAR